TAEAGSTVNVLSGTNSLGTVVADSDGKWSLTSTLAEGAHAITVTATDAVGNPSAWSPVFNLTVDTIAPATPTVNPTNGTSLWGTAEPGSSVAIDTNGDGAPETAVTADANGNWIHTPATALPEGTVVSVTATDPAGNPSASATTTVDRTLPSMPTITSVTDDAAPVIGNVTAGGSTNDTAPTLSGTADAGNTVRVLSGSTLLGTVVADSDGKWSLTPTLAEGAHAITVTATNAAGNATTVPNPAFNLTVDTTAPTAPIVNPSNGTTVSGTAEPGSSVAIDTNGDGTPEVKVTADSDGKWTHTPPTALPDGTVVSVTVTDPAGNPSAPATTTVDAIRPSVPTITSVTDDAAPVIGNIAAGGSTNDTTPTFSGTAEAGSTVNVFSGTNSLGTVVADSDGKWSLTPTLAAGPHAITVTATDPAGNPSPQSPVFNLRVDTTLPSVPTITSVTDDAAPVIGNIAAGGSTNDTTP
ncbi:Ig-like domain-containing protein, partial [Variovorax boronicumulans]|uniref:Ig-like domain-containing protein n=1 Tax=Variovorax boronicumulans TaxID=436515 RepID=UPI00277E4117